MLELHVPTVAVVWTTSWPDLRSIAGSVVTRLTSSFISLVYTVPNLLRRTSRSSQEPSTATAPGAASAFAFSSSRRWSRRRIAPLKQLPANEAIEIASAWATATKSCGNT